MQGGFFIYGCQDLHIGVDHKPLLAFFKENPKPLDQILNKRLRKYVTEINTLKFKVVHISGTKNYLSDCGSRSPTGAAGADKAGSNECTIPRSGADKAGGNECTIPRSEQEEREGAKDCKAALMFAFGANCSAFDADQYLDSIGDAYNYIG